MTLSLVPPSVGPGRSLPPAFGFQHLALGPADRWRCVWWNHGAGTVVARVELLGHATGYDVELDAGDGRTQRALPCEVRRLPDIVLVQP